MEQNSILHLEDGKYISYKYVQNNSKKNYLFLYIHGYSDNMKEAKAMKIEEIANKNNIDLIKLDLYGHGGSWGKKVEMTMDDWYNCCKSVVEKIILPTNKKIIFIGSSLGGWLSYILGEEFKNKAKAVVGIAGAVDFFTEIIEPLIKEENKDKELVYEMVYDSGVPSGDFISRKLIDSSKKYNMLNRKIVNIKCPIRLIHGLIDTVVSFQCSIKFAQIVESEDVKLYLEKAMNHDLTKQNNLNVLSKVMNELINDLK